MAFHQFFTASVAIFTANFVWKSATNVELVIRDALHVAPDQIIADYSNLKRFTMNDKNNVRK